MCQRKGISEWAAPCAADGEVGETVGWSLKANGMTSQRPALTQDRPRAHMSRMRISVIFAGALLAGTQLGAQTSPAQPASASTAELLNRAIDQYNNIEIEAAVLGFRQILSPTHPASISLEQRVTAYHYLGASFADMGIADSARMYFTAALAYDPISDLIPSLQTVNARNAFQNAREKLFAVGAARIVEHALVDSGARRPYPFLVGATQPAAIEVVVVSETDSSQRALLFKGTTDTTLKLAWDGSLGPGLAPAGTYQLRIKASPASQRYSADRSYTFTLEHRVDRHGVLHVRMIPVLVVR